MMASIIAAIIGPFATYENFSFSERLFYWGGMIMGLLVPASLVRTVIYRYLTGPPLRQDLLGASILSVIIGLTVWLFNRYWMGFEVNTAVMFAEHIGIAWMICLVPVAIRAYLRMSLGDFQAQEAAVVEPPMTEGQVAFLRRLNPEKRGSVCRVSADNHQLIVITDKGESKLRLRFGDALEELAEFDGARIHRSHWVAFSNIHSVVPDGRRHAVKLSCGTELPVSPKRLDALREAGFKVA